MSKKNWDRLITIPRKWKRIAVGGAAVLLVATGALLTLKWTSGPAEPQDIGATVASLLQIDEIGEMATYTTTYEGVARVMNAKKPEKTDYYVAYKSKITAGIDFEQIGVAVDDEQKVICLTLPEAHILDVNVDYGSMEYIFLNDKFNSISENARAYDACIQDARTEAEKQETLRRLAGESAENALKAWTLPLVEQLDSNYIIIFE